MIEEAPSPVSTPALRTTMGEAAVAAARAVGYRNAGTIEFLYEDGEFWFLEMNTRIQVEHPVTEMVTGLDLVKWQILVAAGEPLSFGQADVHLDGHAIECRITSEDPYTGFLPSTGRIERLELPSGPGVRWDGGIAEGYEVSLHYDPMLAKLITHGPTRDVAIDRMRRALRELSVTGVETSAPFHSRVMDEPDFRAGNLDIRYVESHADLLESALDEETVHVVALAAALAEEESRRRRSTRRAPDRAAGGPGGWRSLGWRS
jgi:acetyl-CoA carboxylase biotin carboxylase subunit